MTTPPVPEARSLVQFSDGSQLLTRAISFENGGWRVTLAADRELELPFDAVQRIDHFGTRVQPLSALEPTEFEQRSFLSQPLEYVRNRNVLLGPLVLGESRYGWGVGVMSGTRLVYTLPIGFRQFETLVGIDAAASGGGSADFVVLVDGVEQARSGVRIGSDPPLKLGPISIAGATQLELRVDYADGGDVRDYANWCQPVLLR